MSEPSRRLDRRCVLSIAGALVVGAGTTTYLAAHGLRLEHDAPGPAIAPRAPWPGTAALRAELGRCAAASRAAGALAVGTTPPTPGRGATPKAPDASAIPKAPDASAELGATLAQIHADQVTALRDRLAEVDKDSSPTGDPATDQPADQSAGPRSATGEPTGTPEGGARARLLVAQAAGRTSHDLAVIAAAPGPDRRLIASASIGRGAAARLLGHRPSGDPITATAAGLATLPRDVRSALLRSARAGEYGLQVAAAQAGVSQAAAARAALAVTTRLESDLVDALDGQDPPPDLGYPLPYPVSAPQAADRLGRAVLDRLVAALVEAARSGPAPALGALLARGIALEAARTDWGAPPRPLPGLA